MRREGWRYRAARGVSGTGILLATASAHQSRTALSSLLPPLVRPVIFPCLERRPFGAANPAGYR